MALTVKPVGDGPRARALQTVGRYRLCFQLAKGGMATVYLARAEGPGGFAKLFAVKCIHPHLSDQSEFVQMFLDEARLASRIEHRNVCQVFDFGVADGIYYLALEYLRGETLSAIHRRASAPPEVDALYPWVVARCVADAARGVHAAHEVRDDEGRPLELVHRDISPQNIMVGYDGGVRVLDFGIARALDRTTETTSGVMKGKLAYMAPEQLRQQPATRQTDVFSLGVVLWEGLTRKRLFRRANNADVLIAVLSDPIPAPSAVRPELGDALDAVVLRALDRDPVTRFATALDLARRIDEAFDAAGVSVDSAQVGEWVSREFAENRAQAETLTQLARQVDRVPSVRRANDSGTQRTDLSPPPEMPGALEAPPADRRPMRWLAAAGAVALAGLIGLAVALATGEPEPAVERVVEPPPEGEMAGPVEPLPEAQAEAAALGPLAEGDSLPAEPEPAKARHPRPRAQPAAPGRVLVITPGGWADIYERGRRIGRSPGTITLAAGLHTLELRPAGSGPPIRRSVRVVPDEQQTLTVRLRDR